MGSKKKVNKVCTKPVTYQCYVSHEGKAVIMTPVEMVRVALDNTIEVYKRMIGNDRNQIRMRTRKRM
jgi:translation initiation factor IF-1